MAVFGRLQFCLVVGVTTLSGFAAAQNAGKTSLSPLDISVGLVAVSAPEYEGSNKRKSALTPDIFISYRTSSYGTFAVGSKAKGVSWTPIDYDDYSLGLSLGIDGGRADDKDGGGLRTGSTRLRGMGEIKSSANISVFGQVKTDFPVSFAVIKNVGNGKVNSDRSVDGSGGTRLEVSIDVPRQISDKVALSFSPNIVWADRKYTQTYFGVTSRQATDSGFKAYNAKGGIKSIGIAVGANYRFTANWSANAGILFDRLQGDAAKSPLVQTKNQISAAAGITHNF